jgi:energy-coupling factor transporter transmembrane protein EcfT
MIRRRWLLLAGILVLSMVVAYFLRDVVYGTIILPLAYLWWLVKYYYSAIPQLFIWAVLLIVIFLTVVWNFLPEARSNQHTQPKRLAAEGQVEALAVWIRRSHKSNYFKWQVANRLGRIARRLAEFSGQPAGFYSGNKALDQYLDAGINYSFVDFPGPKDRFHRPPPTPLDLDPRETVDHLESQMELRRARHP